MGKRTGYSKKDNEHRIHHEPDANGGKRETGEGGRTDAGDSVVSVRSELVGTNDKRVRVKLYASGYEHIDEFVTPFILSVQAHEPTADLTIVDNGSPVPYPPKLWGAPVKHTENLAIMTSFNQVVSGDWDWLILMDTDVLCRAPFLAQIEQWDDNNLYGMQNFHLGEVEWFDGWLFAIPRKIWDAIGKFDESFKLTGAFQDMDYCLRAVKAGFGLKLAGLPFEHIGANTTHKSPQFWENRTYNMGLIKDKYGVELS